MATDRTIPSPPAHAPGWLSRPAVLSTWCLVAAFGAYACMYGLRKPFTAGTYLSGPYGEGFKAWLITAQVLGYTVSKFTGIRVIAALPPALRAATHMRLVAVALERSHLASVAINARSAER